MITGTTEADCALLMIALPKGEFEEGMSKYGQTREHIFIAFTLGVRKLIIACNKIDEKSVCYSEARYNEVKEEMSDIIKRVGYKLEQTPFIPISGWFGDNLV